MEDLEGANSPPIVDTGALPEGNNDPQDPLAPEIEEENSAATPPFADPHQDMELTEDQAPDVPDQDAQDNDVDSDALSDVDEAQFDDFDANAIAIEERPRVVDADGVALLGKHKRKRDDAEGAEGGGKKKRKEGRREKPKRSKKRTEDGEDDFNNAEHMDAGAGSRRKKRGTAEDGGETRRRKRTPSVERDELLTPEERKSCFTALSS